MTKNLSKKIIQKLFKHSGEIKPDLKYKNVFEITIAVLLSAQTTDRQVNSVTSALFNKYPDFYKLSIARFSDVAEIIKSIGFFRNKSKNIISLSKMIVNDFNNTVPNNLDDLIKLPGIGRKSANVILSVYYKIPALAVDTHVSRISNRLGYSTSANPDKIEADLKLFIPKKDWNKTHLLFIKHGRNICKARKPLCSECPIKDLCISYHNIFCNH